MYEYDRKFYHYISGGSLASARVVVPLLRELLPIPPSSVLDVGCGAGAWLSVWKQQGCQVFGLDGEYVNRDDLLIAADEFFARDLREEFVLQRKFDLVQCLEVAEHLPGKAAPGLVKALCRHADIVFFSAAPPGQGGESHVNEQPYSYWRDLFQANGFTMYDPLRGRLGGHPEVMPWYRYNSFVFVREGVLQEAHLAMADWRIGPHSNPVDVSPWFYRLRKALLRQLPVGAGTGLAKLKKTLFNP